MSDIRLAVLPVAVGADSVAPRRDPWRYVTIDLGWRHALIQIKQRVNRRFENMSVILTILDVRSSKQRVTKAAGRQALPSLQTVTAYPGNKAIPQVKPQDGR